MKNLDSIPRNLERVSYNNVSIILEENDLYFHPEMQRIQIAQIIEYIQCLNLTHIKNIDLNIVTHSPILLSDIPRQNVLFLENGEVETVVEPTFGANIHSLFKHSFFMDLPMGAFARAKISAISSKLNNPEPNQDNSKLLKEIMTIGEPIIRNSLLEKYKIKQKGRHKIQAVEMQIEALQKELTELKEGNDTYQAK